LREDWLKDKTEGKEYMVGLLYHFHALSFMLTLGNTSPNAPHLLATPHYAQDFDSFYASCFELCDLWTDEIAAGSYCRLVEQMQAGSVRAEGDSLVTQGRMSQGSLQQLLGTLLPQVRGLSLSLLLVLLSSIIIAAKGEDE
jgi:hypothetical protein